MAFVYRSDLKDARSAAAIPSLYRKYFDYQDYDYGTHTIRQTTEVGVPWLSWSEEIRPEADGPYFVALFGFVTSGPVAGLSLSVVSSAVVESNSVEGSSLPVGATVGLGDFSGRTIAAGPVGYRNGYPMDWWQQSFGRIVLTDHKITLSAYPRFDCEMEVDIRAFSVSARVVTMPNWAVDLGLIA